MGLLAFNITLAGDGWVATDQPNKIYDLYVKLNRWSIYLLNEMFNNGVLVPTFSIDVLIFFMLLSAYKLTELLNFKGDFNKFLFALIFSISAILIENISFKINHIALGRGDLPHYISC